MSRLFGRAWSITIDTLQLTGHRAQFQIRKSLKPEPNTCNLQIWGLNSAHRSQLAELRPEKGATRGIPVRIEAGYEEATTLLWLGDLRTVESTYDQSGWVTVLGAGDGEKAVQNSRIGESFGAKTDAGTALRAAAKALGVDAGNVDAVASRIKLGSQGTRYQSGRVLYGPTARVIDDIARSADLEWSIQDGALQFVDRGKVLSGSAVYLSSNTGLVGSPTVDNEGKLSATSLIIPDLKPGRLLVIESKSVRGNFRVESAEWSGDTWEGDWYCAIEGSRY